MKDDIMCASILFTVFILLMIVFLFVIFGGNPEGLWWKVERYQKENEEWIEIIRNQLAQIKPDEKRHNRRVPAILWPQQRPAR